MPVQDYNSHMFTGHERDRETGLDYMFARFYGGSLARFKSPDPFSAIDLQFENPDEFRLFLAQPQKWDRYTYVGNNPIAYYDPDGEEAVAATAGAGAAAGAGAGAAATAGAVAGFGVGGWIIGRGIGHIPIGGGQTVDDAVTDFFYWALFADVVDSIETHFDTIAEHFGRIEGSPPGPGWDPTREAWKKTIKKVIKNIEKKLKKVKNKFKREELRKRLDEAKKKLDEAGSGGSSGQSGGGPNQTVFDPDTGQKGSCGYLCSGGL